MEVEGKMWMLKETGILNDDEGCGQASDKPLNSLELIEDVHPPPLVDPSRKNAIERSQHDSRTIDSRSR